MTVHMALKVLHKLVDPSDYFLGVYKASPARTRLEVAVDCGIPEVGMEGLADYVAQEPRLDAVFYPADVGIHRSITERTVHLNLLQLISSCTAFGQGTRLGLSL